MLRARRGIIVNTGTSPSIPPIPGLADTPYWTNHQAIEAEQVPASLMVLGGGAIGAELSQVFARFGAAVTVVEAAGQLLPMEEPEAGELLARVFERDGLTVRTDAAATKVAHAADAFTITLKGGEELTGERLLVATGRRANLAALGLASLGLDESARAHQRGRPDAGGDGVWAIGDIMGKGAFTHMSMYQSEIVIADILGRPHHRPSTTPCPGSPSPIRRSAPSA